MIRIDSIVMTECDIIDGTVPHAGVGLDRSTFMDTAHDIGVLFIEKAIALKKLDMSDFLDFEKHTTTMLFSETDEYNNKWKKFFTILQSDTISSVLVYRLPCDTLV